MYQRSQQEYSLPYEPRHYFKDRSFRNSLRSRLEQHLGPKARQWKLSLRSRVASNIPRSQKYYKHAFKMDGYSAIARFPISILDI